MIATRPHQHSFIDQEGWEVDETPLSGFTLQAHFMKSVENHSKQEAGQKRRRSRYQQLYKERQKLRQAHRDNSETIAFPEIYPQNPQFLTVNTLDLTNTPRRVKWQTAKDTSRIQAGIGHSLEMQPRRSQFKESPRRMKDTPRGEDLGRKMVLQYKPGELIDDLASKHLTHYLRERKEEHLKTRKGIFQLPFDP